MASYSERLVEPSLAGERPEPNLSAAAGRASARLLRPRREGAAAGVAQRRARPGVAAAPQL